MKKDDGLLEGIEPDPLPEAAAFAATALMLLAIWVTIVLSRGPLPG